MGWPEPGVAVADVAPVAEPTPVAEPELEPLVEAPEPVVEAAAPEPEPVAGTGARDSRRAG